MKKIAFFCFLTLFTSNSFADDKIGVGNLDSKIKCDEVHKIIQSPEFSKKTDLEKLELSLVSAKCFAEKHNKENKDDPVVVVVGKDQNNQANVSSKIFFDIIHVKDAKHIAEACAYAAKAGGLATKTMPGTEILIGAVGEYSCGSFLEAAINDDPMLIFAPMMIPGEKVTIQVLSYIGLGDDYQKAVEKAKKPLAKITKKTKKVVKKEAENVEKGKISPADAIAPTVTIPIKILKKIF